MSEFEFVWGKVRDLTGWHHQKQLAEFLGITESNVTEAKRRGVFRPGWIRKVAEAFDISPESLSFDPQSEADLWRSAALDCLPPESRDSKFVQTVVAAVETAQLAETISLSTDRKARLAGFLFDWPVCGEGGQVDSAYVRALVRLLSAD